ncbi:MAG: hypothetical protein E7013_04095 [Alphaproteobacteria bacterium]|nr:hypothetical protein [Alphaproteobacteria bacterium]
MINETCIVNNFSFFNTQVFNNNLFYAFSNITHFLIPQLIKPKTLLKTEL